MPPRLRARRVHEAAMEEEAEEGHNVKRARSDSQEYDDDLPEFSSDDLHALETAEATAMQMAGEEIEDSSFSVDVEEKDANGQNNEYFDENGEKDEGNVEDDQGFEPPIEKEVIWVNRAPVLTLWAVQVALRLGHPRPTALTLGRALAIRYAISKGQSLGLIERSNNPRSLSNAHAAEVVPSNPIVYLRQRAISFFGHVFPVILQNAGTELHVVVDERPIWPGTVEQYLKTAFGPHLQMVQSLLSELAAVFTPPERLNNDDLAYSLYVQFRPEVPPDADGWGARGELDVDRIRQLIEATAV